MASLIIYHNPRCSKSRNTLQIINDKGVEVEIVDYQKSPPNKAQINHILKALALKPRAIMRKNEVEYKLAGLDNEELTEEQQIDLMIQFPKVIERPIVIKGDKAVIGRPPENVLSLL